MMSALQSTALSFDGDGLLKSTQTKLYGAQLEYARRNLLLSLASYIKNLCEYFSRVSDKNLKLSLRVLTLRRTQTVITSVCVRDEPSGRETGDRKGNRLAASELSE